MNQRYGIIVSSDYVKAPDGDFKLYLEEVRKSSGGVFGLSNTSVKEERKKFLKYSPTFLNNISVLVSHESFPTLSRLDEINIAFASKMGYGIPSTTNYERLLKVKKDYFPEMRITEVPNSIQENISGDTNGFGFTDIHYYLEALAQGRPIKRHAVGDQKGDEFAIIMPKNSDWDTVFAEFLTDFIKTSNYREMVTKNLGKGALRMIVN